MCDAVSLLANQKSVNVKPSLGADGFLLFICIEQGCAKNRSSLCVVFTMYLSTQFNGEKTPTKSRRTRSLRRRSSSKVDSELQTVLPLQQHRSASAETKKKRLSFRNNMSNHLTRAAKNFSSGLSSLAQNLTPPSLPTTAVVVADDNDHQKPRSTSCIFNFYS